MASDFDGTLRRYDSGVPVILAEDIAAISAFRKKGNLFGMCSGRAFESILKEDERLPLCNFYIVTTGAVIGTADENGREIIHERCISRTDAESLVNKYGCHKVVYVHMDGRLYRIGRKEKGEKAQIYRESFADLENGRIHGVSIGTDSNETARRICKEISNDYENVRAFQNNDYLDIVAKGSSKGSGVKWLKEYTKADLVAGIGDSFNDIPLLDEADAAFTFNFADDEVKAHADYIVDTVAQALAILEKL